jgi:hypothetical protein
MVIARPLARPQLHQDVVKFTGPLTDDHQQVHALPVVGGMTGAHAVGPGTKSSKRHHATMPRPWRIPEFRYPSSQRRPAQNNPSGRLGGHIAPTSGAAHNGRSLRGHAEDSAVSQHLKVLKSAGLVTDHAAGTRRVYSVDPAGLAAIRDYFEQFWQQSLARFRTAASQPIQEET